MKIEQLEQLLRIVEDGSMNEAAKKLYIARSSLSTSMKNLESEFGEPIFHRYSKGVALTPFGASVYSQAKEICDRVNFLQDLSRKKNSHKFAVASMYCSMGNDAFAVLLERHFQDGKDCVSASIEECSLGGVIDYVQEGLCELGIITLFSEKENVTLQKMESDGLEFHELAQRHLGAIVGPLNPLYHDTREFVDMKELELYPHLENYATPTDHSWEHRSNPTDNYRASYQVSDLGLALRLVATTDAVMVDALDRDVYATLYGRDDYKFIPIRDYPPCRTGWIKRKHTTLSPLAEEYLAILIQEASHAN